MDSLSSKNKTAGVLSSWKPWKVSDFHLKNSLQTSFIQIKQVHHIFHICSKQVSGEKKRKEKCDWEFLLLGREGTAVKEKFFLHFIWGYILHFIPKLYLYFISTKNRFSFYGRLDRRYSFNLKFSISYSTRNQFLTTLYLPEITAWLLSYGSSVNCS